MEFHISTFDEPEKFKPTIRYFHDERIKWFDVADDLPRHRGSDNTIYQHGPTKKIT